MRLEGGVWVRWEMLCSMDTWDILNRLVEEIIIGGEFVVAGV